MEYPQFWQRLVDWSSKFRVREHQNVGRKDKMLVGEATDSGDGKKDKKKIFSKNFLSREIIGDQRWLEDWITDD